MARRSRSREVALQLLFQQDQNKIPLPRPAIEQFAKDRLRDPDLIAFSLTLFDGVRQHQGEIDKLISATAEDWRLHRMMPVVRNVLRIGSFELLHEPEPSPVAAIINEAIELSRRFGNEESSKFVNGILDKIARSRGEGQGARGESEDKTQPQADMPTTT